MQAPRSCCRFGDVAIEFATRARPAMRYDMPALRARSAAVDAPAGITIEVAYLGACGDLLTRQCVPARPLDEGLLVDDAVGAFILFRAAGRSHPAAG